MADITWTDVTDLAPQLASVPVAAQAMYLADANQSLAAAEFDGADGPKFKLARIYLAAHFATFSNIAAGGTSGPVTGESAGGLSVTYANTSIATGWASVYDSTPYGRLYLTLVMRSPARAARVV